MQIKVKRQHMIHTVGKFKAKTTARFDEVAKGGT